MKYKREDIFKSVQTYIMDNCEKNNLQIESSAPLNSYITNSVEFVKVVVDIEEHYGITLTNEELDISNFGTVADLITFIERKVNTD